MLLTRNLYFILLISIICSCKKESNTESHNEIVSGKLKSVIKSFNRQAVMITVEYDVDGRVINYNEWAEDSTYTPVRKYGVASYANYRYDGQNNYPSKSVITNENGQIDSFLFSYNSNSQLIREDHYIRGRFYLRKSYSYISPTLIVIHDSTYNNGSFYHEGLDSLILDNNNSVTTYNLYDRYGLFFNSYVATYDNTKSPFYELNIFKYLYIFGDHEVGYRSKHNITFFKRFLLGTTDHTITQNYIFSANSFPLTAVGRETYNATVMGYSDIKFKYNYY